MAKRSVGISASSDLSAWAKSYKKPSTGRPSAITIGVSRGGGNSAGSQNAVKRYHRTRGKMA